MKDLLSVEYLFGGKWWWPPLRTVPFYTYAFIYYNSHPVPKPPPPLGRIIICQLPNRLPISPPCSKLANTSQPQLSSHISHHATCYLFHYGEPPHHRKNNYLGLVFSSFAQVCPCFTYHAPTQTTLQPRNVLSISHLSHWVSTPWGSYTHFSVLLTHFWRHLAQHLGICGAKSASMW